MKIIDYPALFYIQKDRDFILIEDFTYTIRTIGVPLIGSLIDFEIRLQESIIENDIKTTEILQKINGEYETLSFEITYVEELKKFENNEKCYFNFSRINLKPLLKN